MGCCHLDKMLMRKYSNTALILKHKTLVGCSTAVKAVDQAASLKTCTDGMPKMDALIVFSR